MATTTTHGRGGAGNISSQPNSPLSAEDLATPHIKSSTYTTGRGGQGNMAQNDPERPDKPRIAQDVDAPHHEQRGGTFHWGRGGEGNALTLDANGQKQDPRRSQSPRVVEQGRIAEVKVEGEKPGHQRRGSFKNTLQKGKELLGLKAEKEKVDKEKEKEKDKDKDKDKEGGK